MIISDEQLSQASICMCMIINSVGVLCPWSTMHIYLDSMEGGQTD